MGTRSCILKRAFCVQGALVYVYYSTVLSLACWRLLAMFPPLAMLGPELYSAVAFVLQALMLVLLINSCGILDLYIWVRFGVLLCFFFFFN